MGLLGACFAALPDPRTGNATRHDLLEVLTIALVGSICGAETCVDFADFARDREALFRDFLKLERACRATTHFRACSACWTRWPSPPALRISSMSSARRDVLAIDGKTLRRSFDRAGSTSPLAGASGCSPEGEPAGHAGRGH